MRLIVAIVLAVFAGVLPGSVSAQSGVGVNVGKIQIDQKLSTGGSYNLPSIGVINTGHDASDYSVRISFLADQEEQRPPENWFSFSPLEFRLEPGETRTVGIRLKVPVTARSGDYFALVEAFPVPPERTGVVIGIAAATKLTFTVQASNRFFGSALWTYHRVNDRSPYSYVIAGLIVFLPFAFWFRRRLRINISFERRD